MRRLGIYFLAFSWLWVATWLATDRHDWPAQSQAHQFSVVQIVAQHDTQHSDASHCRNACSYDHGGHIGQTLPIATPTNIFIHASQFIFSPYAYFWHSNITPPKLRPPIAV